MRAGILSEADSLPHSVPSGTNGHSTGVYTALAGRQLHPETPDNGDCQERGPT